MKAIQSIFILLFVAIVFASNSKQYFDQKNGIHWTSIIHPFSKKELGHLLSKKSDKNVVLVFMSKSCQECEKKLYDINVAFNAYDEYKDVCSLYSCSHLNSLFSVLWRQNLIPLWFVNMM